MTPTATADRRTTERPAHLSEREAVERFEDRIWAKVRADLAAKAARR